MRVSQYLLATLKTAPKNCETISHQLMFRAGLIRQVSSGLYVWLPTGLRVLQKIKNIVREEMNKSGAIEISMPIVQPAKLWKKSGRWTEYGKELLRFKNRNNQNYVLSPTHEEMVSDIFYKEMVSYNQEFPLNVYQINTKYRDEIRPCFGIIRSREFIMKDGYSFHITQKSLQNTYNKMYNTYCDIFNRIALNFCVTQANPGKIGGTLSHEFQAYFRHKKHNVLTPIIISKENTNNIHMLQPKILLQPIVVQSSVYYINTTRLIKIPYIHSIKELTKKFNLPIQKIVKTIIVHAANRHTDIYSQNFFGLVIRADHQLNRKKVEMIPQISIPLSFANTEEIYNLTGDPQPNLLGSINLSIPLIIDYNVAIMSNFIAGSNIHDKYFFGINWNQDLPLPKIADLYEKKYDCHLNINKISSNKFIEIGHIFQLGQKYSKIIYQNNNSNCNRYIKKNSVLNMGCYGIGITRIVAAIIEQYHDKNGIIWPEIIAPFKIAIIPINMYHSINVRNTAEKIYKQLLSLIGTDILIDDRPEHPGKMFSDIDLIGIPHILIISDRNLRNQEIEYKQRKTGLILKIKINMLLQFLAKKFSN